MAPTFSATRTNVTVTASIDPQGRGVTEYDVRTALESVARDYGVTVRDLSVTVAPGERTVTMTESEYNALRAGGPSAE